MSPIVQKSFCWPKNVNDGSLEHVAHVRRKHDLIKRVQTQHGCISHFPQPIFVYTFLVSGLNSLHSDYILIPLNLERAIACLSFCLCREDAPRICQTSQNLSSSDGNSSLERNGEYWTYYVSKKSWPNLHSNLPYKMGQELLGRLQEY